MGACHGPKGVLDNSDNGSEPPSYAGCCAADAGGNLLRGACLNSLKRKDADLEALSPAAGRVQDAHREVVQGFACCSTAPRRAPAAAATSSTVSRTFSIDGSTENREVQPEGSTEPWHGAGVLSWPDGRRYVGQFNHGAFEGDATMTWPDGRKYIGQYRQNKKHGEGDFLWRDGRRYSGQWNNGVRHGNGIYTNARGEKRAGTFWQDRPVNWIGEVFRTDSKGPEVSSPDPEPCQASEPKDISQPKAEDQDISQPKAEEEASSASSPCPEKEGTPSPVRADRSSPSHGGA